MSIIKFEKITEHKDGSATYSLQYTKDFNVMVRNYFKKKRCSSKMIKKFILIAFGIKDEKWN